MAGQKSDITKYKLLEENEKLITGNLNLIRQVIQDHFTVYAEYYEDMFQEGCIGMIKAAAKFKNDRSSKFSSYAYFCIKNEIHKFVSERTDNIKVPVTVRMAIAKFNKMGVNSETIDPEKHSDILKKYQTTIPALKSGEMLSSVSSLDIPIENTEGLSLGDVVPDPNADVLEIITNSMDEAYLVSREMVSNLHDWLNYEYPDDLFNNRVYCNYIYWYDREPSYVDRMRIICNELGINRNLVRDLLPTYNTRFKIYLKNRKNKQN